MNIQCFMRSLLIALLCAYSIGAKANPSDANLLGSKLTELGAEVAPNADGTIPAFTGKPPVFPDWVYKAKAPHVPNPYAGEKPLFVITAENYKQHQDKLTVGQMAMFERYPDTFKMPIYPTHRNMVFPDEVYQWALRNHETAKLVDGGNGFTDAFGAVPFPIPENGQEMIWNHIVRFGTHNIHATHDGAIVYNKGHIGMVTTKMISQSYYLWLAGGPEKVGNIFGKRVMEWLEPKRRRGEMVLVHEPMNQVAESRSAWSYLPATRRVRRAPVVAYDTPQQAGNIMTTDDGRLFNGAIDRYNWTIKGKREVYIPYNNYDMDKPNVSYKELLTRNHVNPQYMRYELHRVWVLEATLKKNARHVYAKRVFYLDEDTWYIQLADIYDGKGELWRTHSHGIIYHPAIPGAWGRVQMFHDLISGDYVLANLINEQKQGERINQSREPEETFTPSGLLMRARQ